MLVVGTDDHGVPPDVAGWRGEDVLLHRPSEQGSGYEVVAVGRDGEVSSPVVEVEGLVSADDITYAADLFDDVVSAHDPDFPPTGPPDWVWLALALVPVAAGGWWWLRRRRGTAPQPA